MRATFNLFGTNSLSWGCTTTEFFLFGDHGLDTVVHVLDEIDLGATESAFVRDVVNMISRFTVLTVNTSDLDVIFVRNFLELWHLSSELGKSNMHRCSEGSTKISWA